ncbi:MAG: helix-turn-helix transcriptional regulator [Clostridia bacterium]|nr:helix-turn-helix transcriptional regulator [Clostridia bacterium]
MEYSKKIKLIREKMILTQEELAVALGVSSVTVCRWETGKCEPTIKVKKIIKRYIEDNNLVLEER